MNKIELAKGGKTVCRLVFMFFFMYAAFNTGAIYGKYHEEGQTIMAFFTSKVSYEWEARQDPPEELIMRVKEYNTVTKMIWIAMIFSFGIMAFDFVIDPKNHFITKLKEKYGGKDGQVDN